MCFVRSWNTWLFAITTCIADTLSQWSTAFLFGSILNFFNIYWIKVIYDATCAINMYSASAEDREITGCFLDFQEISDVSKEIQ